MDLPVSGPPLITDHSEIYVSRATGETIRVRCRCAVGHDHTFAEWMDAAPEQELHWAQARLRDRLRGR
ncbi:hypothetical protein [Leifsonia sp. NPDC080035]|uniref:Uncharacterized protein n=1 Tax=Leifsonia sp. NPDC080035 TaxID=3143936 RepID=A0AAU7GDC8_9MICO